MQHGIMDGSEDNIFQDDVLVICCRVKLPQNSMASNTASYRTVSPGSAKLAPPHLAVSQAAIKALAGTQSSPDPTGEGSLTCLLAGLLAALRASVSPWHLRQPLDACYVAFSNMAACFIKVHKLGRQQKVQRDRSRRLQSPNHGGDNLSLWSYSIQKSVVSVHPQGAGITQGSLQAIFESCLPQTRQAQLLTASAVWGMFYRRSCLWHNLRGKGNPRKERD